ncbi:MAG: DUF2807 domain-containing protein [Muribaculaceae bacterium]|nr:DUF2807 domain-containing protein [Muribaculaceae bacterium]
MKASKQTYEKEYRKHRKEYITAFLLTLCISLFTGMLKAETFNLEVGQFEKLKINGNLTVVYKNLPDSTGMARFSAQADSPEEVVEFSTKGDGTLKIEPADSNWGATDLPVVFVYSDFLSNLESYSEKNVWVASVAPCATFSVNQVGNGTISIDNLKCNNLTAAISTGNGSIYINGSCLNANYRMVGAGLISADQMRADNVKCRILGTGSIGCWALENLNVTGLGATKIYYKGSPKIKKTGGGKLFDLPEEMDEDAYSRLGTPVATFTNPSEEDTEDDDDEEYQTVVSEDEEDEQTEVSDENDDD